MPRKLTTQDFIEKAKGIHGDKYDYSLVEYVNSFTKVTIICPDHGEFEQAPNKHLSDQGCRECGRLSSSKLRSSSGNQFIEKAKLKHDDKYDYSMVKYINSSTKVTIICPHHGEWAITPNNHLNGNGCKACGYGVVSNKLKSNTDEFIEKSIVVHGNTYVYGLVEYTDRRKKVVIVCKKHGEFKQTTGDHLKGCGCPSCACNGVSKPEQEIADFIKSKGITVLQSDRTILGGLELDIVLPDFKLAIEFNGLYRHSEEFKPDKNYHRNKTLGCEENGYRLIHIWGDDYMLNKERELNFISHQLGLNKTKTVYARKCEVRFIDKDAASKFLNEHHVQGMVLASHHIGLYHDDELVSCTSFTNRGEKGYELVRHASQGCVGSLGKATKYFVKNVSDKVYTFCDIARFTGESYEKAGFEKVGEIRPDYKYVVGKVRKHKFGFRLKHIKVKYPEVYADWKTEKQMMEEKNIHRIWDCGKIRYAIIKI